MALLVVGIPAFGTDQPWKNTETASVPQPEPSVKLHVTRASVEQGKTGTVAERSQIEPAEAMQAPPTRSSFLAKWAPVSGAEGYRLDVSSSPAFDSSVDGYCDLDVGGATAQVVTGLSKGTTYYYRVRAYNSATADQNSAVSSATTNATSGLIIDAHFDSSVTSHPSAAIIEATIQRAVAIYESFFTDPIRISILFRYSRSAPNGGTLNGISQSAYVIYPLAWDTYINALKSAARTKSDYIANRTLPGTPLSSYIKPASANGRALGLNTPPAMFANATVGSGGPYDGIVTLNSAELWQFSRPAVSGRYDALRAIEHEIDEVMGLGSSIGRSSNLSPEDLFSWGAQGYPNVTSTGSRYFSIDGGRTFFVYFNQDPEGDFGDWYSDSCPQANPYVQNAFVCTGQFSDVTVPSYEAMGLDVIGYRLTGGPHSNRNDFNGDGKPDYVLYNPNTRQTAIWYMDNNFRIGSIYGPTLPSNWNFVSVADFNRDNRPDYLLFNSSTRKTAIWCLSGGSLIAGAYGPDIPQGWQLKATGDFNNDAKPDYVLYNPTTYQVAFWYMDNNARVGSIYAATLDQYSTFAAVGDFSYISSGYLGFVVLYPIYRYSYIWFRYGDKYEYGEKGPNIAPGYELIGTADFDRDGNSDYLLFNPSTGRSAIWYLNNDSYSVLLRYGAYGPTVPSGWKLVGP